MFRRGLIRGELLYFTCDDDLINSNAFEIFCNYYEKHPVEAMVASQDLVTENRDGTWTVTGERRAKKKMGLCIGESMDCKIDSGQICVSKKLVEMLGDPYWPEGKETESHADGVFMNNLSRHECFMPIDVKIGLNRRSFHSVFNPAR